MTGKEVGKEYERGRKMREEEGEGGEEDERGEVDKDKREKVKGKKTMTAVKNRSVRGSSGRRG